MSEIETLRQQKAELLEALSPFLPYALADGINVEATFKAGTSRDALDKLMRDASNTDFHRFKATARRIREGLL